MLKVVAAVYLLNFFRTGPDLVPFDSMMACEAARSEVVQRLSVSGRDFTDSERRWNEKVKKRARELAEVLICVKAK